MKVRFLIAAALGVLAAPALASQPDDQSAIRSNGQTVQTQPGQYPSDAYGGQRFGDRWQSQDDMRSYERSHNNLVPPRMDSSGVPDPRA